jgi:hypothetical protein
MSVSKCGQRSVAEQRRLASPIAVASAIPHVPLVLGADPSCPIPTAAAIQNARLCKCAKIYGTEVEKQTSDVEDMQKSLERFRSKRP